MTRNDLNLGMYKFQSTIKLQKNTKSRNLNAMNVFYVLGVSAHWIDDDFFQLDQQLVMWNCLTIIDPGTVILS